MISKNPSITTKQTAAKELPPYEIFYQNVNRLSPDSHCSTKAPLKWFRLTVNG